MKLLAIQALVFSLIMIAVPAEAQQEGAVELQQLTDHIYKITAVDDYEVSFVASVGEDGILLIDTGFKATAQELKEKLDSLGVGPVRYVVTTHEHVDHTGGNALFGKQATIIGYEKLRNVLTTGYYILQEYPDETFPVITFHDAISLFFNGEEVKVVALPGSHSGTDVIVIFPKSKVAYLGDLAYGNKFPSFDAGDGNAARYAEIVRKAMEYLPEDVTVVSGHGDNCSMTQMKEYLEMLEETTNLVREGLDQGKDVATLKEGKIFSKWEDKGYGDLYVSADDWIDELVMSIEPQSELKKSIIRPLYDAFQENGVEGVKSRYSEIKMNHSDEYDINTSNLYSIGYYMVRTERYDEALQYFKFIAEEYPDNWMWYYGLGKTYLATNKNELAVKSFKKVLELSPGNPFAIEKLKMYDPNYIDNQRNNNR